MGADMKGAVKAFRAEFASPSIVPGDDRYDEDRAIWSGSFDRRPAVIAKCQTTADVQAVLTLARDTGMALAVRGGGHSLSGMSTCDDGIVLDFSLTRGVSVD